jgi:hypothetical protein
MKPEMNPRKKPKLKPKETLKIPQKETQMNVWSTNM